MSSADTGHELTYMYFAVAFDSIHTLKPPRNLKKNCKEDLKLL